MDESIDIFDADGALTREFLLDRGYCCQNGCRNCPYGFRKPAVDGTSTTPSTSTEPVCPEDQV